MGKIISNIPNTISDDVTHFPAINMSPTIKLVVPYRGIRSNLKNCHFIWYKTYGGNMTLRSVRSKFSKFAIDAKVVAYDVAIGSLNFMEKVGDLLTEHSGTITKVGGLIVTATAFGFGLRSGLREKAMGKMNTTALFPSPFAWHLGKNLGHIGNKY